MFWFCNFRIVMIAMSESFHCIYPGGRVPRFLFHCISSQKPAICLSQGEEVIPFQSEGTPRSPPSVANTQSRLEHLFQPLSPSTPWLLFSFLFFFIIHVRGSLERWVRVVCVGEGGWGRRRGQGGGEGIHLIPGSRCIYWRLITEQQSHHALDDFIIWFLGVGRAGEGSGTKTRGSCRTIVNTWGRDTLQLLSCGVAQFKYWISNGSWCTECDKHTCTHCVGDISVVSFWSRFFYPKILSLNDSLKETDGYFEL